MNAVSTLVLYYMQLIHRAELVHSRALCYGSKAGVKTKRQFLNVFFIEDIFLTYHRRKSVGVTVNVKVQFPMLRSIYPIDSDYS